MVLRPVYRIQDGLETLVDLSVIRKGDKFRMDKASLDDDNVDPTKVETAVDNARMDNGLWRVEVQISGLKRFLYVHRWGLLASWYRAKETILSWIARKLLPSGFLYHCGIQIWAEVTTGKYADVEPSELKFQDAIRMYARIHGIPGHGKDEFFDSNRNVDE